MYYPRNSTDGPTLDKIEELKELISDLIPS